MADTLDTVFDGDGWRRLVGMGFDEQADACIDLLRSMIGARWATYIRMLGKNNATRYMLLHLTNHDAGRDRMKDCMWKVSPIEGYVARASEDPGQQFLISPEPDLEPLRQWVLDRLVERPRRWQDLIDEVRAEMWRDTHLNDVIRELRRGKVIEGHGRGYFAPKNNPELRLVE